jgi:hypothetical protein
MGSGFNLIFFRYTGQSNFEMCFYTTINLFYNNCYENLKRDSRNSQGSPRKNANGGKTRVLPALLLTSPICSVSFSSVYHDKHAGPLLVRRKLPLAHWPLREILVIGTESRAQVRPLYNMGQLKPWSEPQAKPRSS